MRRKAEVKIKYEKVGGGGGAVVSVLAFSSDDPSSNPVANLIKAIRS